ncbi:MAG TPA: glycosyltransferase [Pseudolabrys sp.]|nr:glycosyltransferase [Pseudolabrys sp.]
MRVYVDHTHLWHHVTGLERITLQLFSREALAPLDAVPITASGMRNMVLAQTFGLPAHLAGSPSSLLLCPGFPPTPLLQAFASRVIPYIHDVFLISRRADLNWRAKLYSAWPFSLAVRRLPRFFVNSGDTATKLRQFCRDDAEITFYRPVIPNNFKLSVGDRATRPAAPVGPRLVALGTVEPRKNMRAAAAVLGALRAQGYPNATLEVIGRRGWGDDWDALSATPGVILHGFQPDNDVTAILARADILICTSHEEGLGLPLLEAQYAGLPVVAPDQPVFREVLDRSGVFIDTRDPRSAAGAIAGLIGGEAWRAGYVGLAEGNLRRWNDQAAADHSNVIDLLMRLGRSGRDAAEQARMAG